MIVRAERDDDRAAIRAVHLASFPTSGEARLVDALRDAGNLTVSLVAEEGGEIVGHVGISPVRLDDTDDGVGLAPVAVVPTARRRGIAAQLIRSALDVCISQDRGFIVILGDPAYYGRFGVSAASGWNLRDEYGGGDAFQAMEFRPGAIPSAGGLVRYATEFAVLDEAAVEPTDRQVPE